MFNKAVKLELVEHADGLLWVFGLRAEPNHHTHHLLVDVLAFLFLFHALLIDLPTALEILSFRVPIDQSCVANNVGYKAHLLSHLSHQSLCLP